MKRRYALLGMTVLLAAALAVPAFGGPGNPVADTFAGAKKTSKKALTKAKRANRKAKDAKKAANNAQGAAETAQGAASDANTAAGSAQSSADSADAKAIAAQTSADAAQTSADAAQTSADAAQATADSKFDTEEFVQGPVSASNNGDKLVIAVCPAGSTPTGGGYTLAGAGAEDVSVILDSRFLAGWLISAKNTAAANFTAAATVNCVS